MFIPLNDDADGRQFCKLLMLSDKRTYEECAHILDKVLRHQAQDNLALYHTALQREASRTSDCTVPTLATLLYPKKDTHNLESCISDLKLYDRYIAYLIATRSREEAANILGITRMGLYKWLSRRQPREQH